jgi:TatD DNase family protein
MRLFDTHAHLDDEQFRDNIEQQLAEAQTAGVVSVTSIGTTLASSQRSVELAQEYPGVYAAVGIHPNHCQEASENDWQSIRRLATEQRVVAIGETGLDRYWDYTPFDQQQTWFARHIELSYQLQKPLVIHQRDCESDMLAILAKHQQHGKVLGIMHSYCGSLEAAQQYLDWGMYISFSGMVTFKKSEALRELVREIPLDRLLIETDSPYLSPHPRRSQRPNSPALLPLTAVCIADVRGMSIKELTELTTINALRVFGLEPVI